VLGGTEDAIFPVEEVVARMRKLVPKLEARLVPGMGHALVNMTGFVLPWIRTPSPAQN
jgi:hypothetical protein